MPTCEWCGEDFELSDAESEFDGDMRFLSYEHIRKSLCGSCAIQAIEDEVDGVYFETCEKCGKIFDFIIDSSKFLNKSNGVDLQDCWDNLILCCDCALDNIG
ncbi:MAG: hypothetical protein HFF06_07550 [Oscillospiraceae bacterium]|nr:hypothetical protein [Oscillospiraceae bacterium]